MNKHYWEFECIECDSSGDGYGWKDLHTGLAGRRSLGRLREEPQTHLHRGTQSAGDPKHAGGLGPFW